MAEDSTAIGKRDIVPRRLAIVPRQLEKRTVHHHVTELRYPDWTNFTNQRHIRDLAIDNGRGWFWMATWGGILCWQPEKELCWRYTSEQGLSGNAICCLTVDRLGIIWAAGHEVGLYSFNPECDPCWQTHQDFENWKVSCLAPHPKGGIYAIVENDRNQYALGKLASHKEHLQLLIEKGLAIKDVATLLVDEQEVLWLGNPWGLHCWQGKAEPKSFEVGNKQVRALAEAVGGGLWLGTNWGLHRFQISSEPWQSPDWTREEISSLAMDSETGDLWAITAAGIGCITDGIWKLVAQSPPGQLTKAIAPPNTLKTHFQERQVLVSGANGLYLTSIDSSKPAFTHSDEDTLSNAVQCLWADEEVVWVGTARGLHYFDRKAWHGYGTDAPQLRDVRVLLPDREQGRLWVGTFRVGLQRFEQGVYIPNSALKVPITSLTAGLDGTLWAATFDAIYCRPSGKNCWESISHLAEEHIGQELIQAICYQSTEETLWVGTSSGLFRYRPQLGLWDAAQDFAPGELENLSIQSLAIDPHFNLLWIGTAKGLFRREAEDTLFTRWSQEKLDVRSIAFSETGYTLWIGTASGLKRWSDGLFNKGGKYQSFMTNTSGISSNIITALSVRRTDNGHEEVWIGTPRGVCCYRYQPMINQQGEKSSVSRKRSNTSKELEVDINDTKLKRTKKRKP